MNTEIIDKARILNCKQVLFFTRPWEWDFHRELALKILDENPKIQITFYTFFKDTYKNAIAQFETYFLPDLLKNMSSDYPHDFINSVEQYSGISFSMMVDMERFLPKDIKKRKKFIATHTNLAKEIIPENCISISSMFDHFIYVLIGYTVNLRGGAHFALLQTGVPSNKCIAFKNPWELWKSKSKLNYADYLERTRIELSKPPHNRINYMKLNSVESNLYQRISKSMIQYKINYQNRKSGNYFSMPFYKRFKISIKSKLKPLYLLRYENLVISEKQMISLHRRFIYIPLHLEPEATILMYSPLYRNQLEMIRVIRNSLPYQVHLIIKENPKMIGDRKTNFYKEVLKLHNTHFISNSTNPHDIYEHTVGVISIASNSCLEASLLGLPAYTFGNPPFSKIFKKKELALKELAVELDLWFTNTSATLDFGSWTNFIDSVIDFDIFNYKTDPNGFSNLLNFIKSCK